MNQILWQPTEDQIETSNLTRLMDLLAGKYGAAATDFASLHEFSVDNKEAFWSAVVEFAAIKGDGFDGPAIENAGRMPGAKFFPGASLNYAENLLRRRDSGDAIIFRGEDRVQKRLSHKELYDAVSRLAQALRKLGIAPGDRVAGYLPNLPETVIAMLAATSIGAIWSSCSPDFGVAGVLDRFGQIEPKILFACDGYFYNGKALDSLAKMADILAELPSVEATIIVPYASENPDISGVAGARLLPDLIDGIEAGEIDFARLPFGHPLYIMYSSGTTGVPKCIVHGAGGVLLKHLTEHLFHCDEKPDDRVFYFTTCGWMMWNWQVSALAAGATLILYDGSPFYPDGNVLFDYAEAEAMTLFGTSAKYIDAVKKAGLKPKDSHDLSSLRLMTSTGSPLAPESFDFVYQWIKPDIHLASISGGTDIVGCFVLGNPIGPVWRGEIQAPGLGLEVAVYDDAGKPVTGEQGDLVCAAPFPSMPIEFWNDADGSKYRAAYFEKFPGVWCHGDWAEMTEHGGMIIYGRSDATLNPGGVRIGTAEIYRQVEQFDEIMEGIAIGQDWDDDTRIILFVIMRQGIDLSDELRDQIRTRIRANCTPRHVPAKIVAVADIPRTKSGKITELAVRDVVHGRGVKNIEALANPDALKHFEGLEELSQ
ncbi:MAG: acetoacetate--CoA ligase [Rhodospirillales bacterium]|nr:acetoacetate--CoA ligase [Rhodospirillales bacterium]MDP6642673.1 acetoacetate--CoA ligase [Rhodospirillales bacterium]MDP6840186.1 acetoacetate--CoA ligase [Rhodospirillales bacterium]